MIVGALLATRGVELGRRRAQAGRKRGGGVAHRAAGKTLKTFVITGARGAAGRFGRWLLIRADEAVAIRTVGAAPSDATGLATRRWMTRFAKILRDELAIWTRFWTVGRAVAERPVRSAALRRCVCVCQGENVVGH